VSTQNTQPQNPPKSRLILPILVLAVLIAIVVLGVWLASRPPPDQIHAMVDTDEIRVAAKAPGRLETLLAAEGDTVKAGQPLFTLSNEELNSKLAGARSAELALRALQAKAQAGAQQEDIATALAVWQARQAAADVAGTTAARVENLFKEGVVAAQKRDEAAAAALAAAESAKAALAQYEKALAGTRAEDREAIAAQVAAAAAAVSAVASLQAELQAVAPVNGQISRRYANTGEILPPGFPVFTLINPDDLWIAFNVREDQFHGISIGQVLTGAVPALDNHAMRFKIYYINPRGDFATWRATRLSDGYDIRTFEVRARPAGQDESAKKLRPGMSVLFDWPQPAQ
jgi:HlyD family secretion protein